MGTRCRLKKHQCIGSNWKQRNDLTNPGRCGEKEMQETGIGTWEGSSGKCWSKP